MTDRYEHEYREFAALLEDPRSRADIVARTERHLIVDLDCKGVVKRPDGVIAPVARHRVRFVRAPDVHGLLTLYEPVGGMMPYHPNIRSEPPLIICADLEQQMARGPVIPLWQVAAMVYDILGANAWSLRYGVFNTEATKWYAAAQARGELPFEERTLI
jgi:hypothetical protein